MRWPSIITIAWLALGCGKASPKQVSKPLNFNVQLTTVSDEARPVAGVELFANFKPVGKSNTKGVLELKQFKAQEGSVIRIDSRCPSGFLHEGQSQLLRARRQASTKQNQLQELEVSVTCVPTHRSVALMVRIEQEQQGDEASDKTPEWFELPLMLNGKELTKTNREGVAHIAMKVKNNNRFEVVLDTSDYPDLEPQNPARSVVVENQDTTFVFDQTFYVPVPEKPEVVETVKKPPKRRKPTRKKPQPKPETKVDKPPEKFRPTPLR